MTGSFAAADALGDAFLSMGFAAAVSFVYHILMFSPPRNKWISCAAHAAFFIPVGVLSFCFVAGATAAKTPRWYIAAGAAAGAAIYLKCASRAVGRALSLARSAVRAALRPLAAALAAVGRVLQKPLVKVYNRTVEGRAKRARRRKGSNGVDGEGARGAKQPRRAYTQT